MPATDTFSERTREIVDEFALFPDWMGKYQYLIEMGDDMPKIEDEYKTEEYKIHGCQSDVWIRAEYDADEGVLTFRGDSNAKITRGLAALIIRVLQRQDPDTVVEAEFDFLDDIGMQEHLTSQRQNGLAAMIQQMKERAARYQEA